MADIAFQFPINAPVAPVFQAIATPLGLDAWWTLRSMGVPAEGAVYELWFGPEYDWRARVTRAVPDQEFELEITVAQQDWLGTRVSFRLAEQAGLTIVHFRHSNWPEANAHFQISCYCWAMYLRLLRRFVEHGEVVAYAERDAA
jgi:uncharacterized protein YndB with AHSA1/START domain